MLRWGTFLETVSLGSCLQEAVVSLHHGRDVHEWPCLWNLYLNVCTHGLEHMFETWTQSIPVAPNVTKERFSPH